MSGSMEVNPPGPVHATVYGPVPPVVVLAMLPSCQPAQLMFCPKTSREGVSETDSGAGWPTWKLKVLLHAASVMVTEYVPAGMNERSFVVAEKPLAPDHR